MFLSLTILYPFNMAFIQEEGSCSDDEEIIRKELSGVPLEDLQKIREKIGTKRFDSALRESLEERKLRSFKRANKNRPSEISSNKPVSIFREVIPVPKKNEVEKCDPRFDERAGKLNKDLFKKSFNFIDEMKSREKQAVMKECKRVRNPKRKEKLQRLIQQMESREAAAAKKDAMETMMREHKKAERELSKKGKKPFYIKKSTQKKIELAQKYAELKKSGKLEKFMSKKRKKNMIRDKKELPFK